MIQPSRALTYVVGGGLTGISAALHLGCPYRLVERDNELGGLARTEERDGFFFDRTGHWLHLRDSTIKELVLPLMGDDLALVHRRARVFSNGVLTRYPFQANLHGLPPQVAYECLIGLIQSRLSGQTAAPDNFEEYILHHFGEGIARHFMIPYNTKLWGVSPREITSAWCSRFVPIPTVEQVVAGALDASPPDLGYNVSFYYPRQGGIETFSRALASKVDPETLRLGVELTGVDPTARTISLDGETLPYRALVSTVPLPQLVRLIKDPPEAVAAAAERLRATTIHYLNVAVRTRPPQDYHWVYVPEERFPFYRVGIFSNAMPSMAPPGRSNLYVELASDRRVPDCLEDLLRDLLPGLVEIGALTAVEDVIFADLRRIEGAYVVFDEAYAPSLARIFPYLEQHRIFSCGRYGSWIYNSMEDSLLAGREVATLVNRLGPDQSGPARHSPENEGD